MSTTKVKEDYKPEIMECLGDFSPAKLRLLTNFVEYLYDKGVEQTRRKE